METRELFEAVRSRVERKLQTSPDGSHDFDHTLRVLHNARRLLEELPGADRKVVEIAALLHDVARPEETAGGGTPDHAELGAEQAREILAELGAPETVISKVAGAVLRHRFRSGRGPETLEEMILYDADKLDSLGAVGIGRAFQFAGNVGARLHNTRQAALGACAYSREDTAYREYLVKLNALELAMRTEPGRRLAAGRIDFMRRFFDQLNTEVFG